MFVFGTESILLLKRSHRHPGFAFLLGLLVPGMGHVFWREYLFGLFVFLVMIIASVLVFFSFLVELPALLKWVLFGLPALFYLFTFIDLKRAIDRKRATSSRSGAVAVTFLVGAVAINVLLPLSPTNFLLHNRPALTTIHARSFRPLFEKGDLCLIDRSAYRVDLFFLNQPIIHSRPDRWDLISFSEGGARQLGLVVGYGGEDVSYVDGVLLVDGAANNDRVWAPAPEGEIPLTRVDAGGILVATLSEGALVGTAQISDRNIVGKVHRLF